MRSCLIKNKRGDFPSGIIMVAIVFALALGAVFGSHILSEVMSEMKVQPQIAETGAAEVMETIEEDNASYLDFFVFFLLVSMIIGMIIASLYVNTNPAVMIAFIIVMFIGLLLAGLFANIWWEIGEDSTLSATMDEFTYTNLILGEAFPVIIFVSLMIVIVILYGKTKNGGEI